ncbi:hypothetical protein [Azospirillum tabaci]|uniref:hypothetical protein n=1 Tax=Azospirillum tabaci TaxID=2752310 RepID=UPI0016601B38|nr:hypothetical protein [Azospirillum tabaci]
MTARSTTIATAARELLAIIVAGVEPAPDPEALASLEAALQRQIVAVGPAVASAVLDRLKAAPGPADPALRRARFTGLAAVIASEPAGRP